MRMFDIISHKKNADELTDEEINFFINGYLNDTIPDYQVSALLMAISINGMSKRETVSLTKAMAKSGNIVDLSSLDGITVDKHSTGGVGDKTTLIIAPIVASLGCKIAKMSGRGLGHTGGTVDKLEAIPNFRTSMSTEDFVKQANDIGIAIIGQSADLAPADKKLYALRDVTGTIDSVPLIASSIMSKKLASGSSCIVLDVKSGSGAFMKNVDDARKLACEMVDIGKAAGKKTAALITNMNIPLGYAVGNSLEIIEAVEVLKGNDCDNLKAICIELSSVILHLAFQKDLQTCKKMAEDSLNDGSALKKFKEMVVAQGGDVRFIDNTDLFKKALVRYDVTAKESGYISYMNTESIGTSAVVLGAGRVKKDDEIDNTAGILLYKKTGDAVNCGDTIASFFTSDEHKLDDARRIFETAVTFSSVKPTLSSLVYDVVL